MKYRIYDKTAKNIEPESYQHYDEAVHACLKTMSKNLDREFTILNEREL